MKTRFYILLTIYLSFGSLTHGQYRYSYLQLGQREYSEANYLEAIKYLTYYIKEHPTLYKAYFLRGLSKYQLADLNGAEHDLNQSIICLPELPKLYLVRGIIRSEKYELNESLNDFSRAISLDSAYTDAYFYRALAYLNLKNYSKALLDAEQVISINDDYTNSYILRGAIKAQLESYESAIEDFNVAIKRNPENGRAYLERGTAFARLDKIGFAMLDFDTALEQDSLDAYAYFQRGLAKMEIDDFEGALQDFNRVTEIAPGNELAIFNRALINSYKRSEGQAIEDFIHILNQNPDNMLVYYNLGLSFYRVGEFQAAIESFNNAIKLFPDYADAYQQRALAKQALGLVIEAQNDMDTYEDLLRKNSQKNDSTKYQEGIQLLKLTHLENEYLKKEDRKDKIQYQDIDIQLKPIYRIELDSLFTNRESYFDPGGFSEFVPRCDENYGAKNASDSALTQTRLKQIEKQLAADSSCVKCLLKQGLLFKQMGNLHNASQNFTKAITLNQHNYLSYFCRANATLDRLDSLLMSAQNSSSYNLSDETQAIRLYSDIIHDLDRALSLNPDFIYAPYNKAIAHFLMQDYRGAKQVFTEITRTPILAEAHFNKALLQLYTGEKEQACYELGVAGELGLKDAYPTLKRFCK